MKSIRLFSTKCSLTLRQTELLLKLITLLSLSLFLQFSMVLYANAQEPEPGLNPVAAWSSIYEDISKDMAWGDFDNDGDLDLAVGTEREIRIFRNDGKMLEATSALILEPEHTGYHPVAWGDMDNDHDLDLVVGYTSGPNHIYFNEDGVLQEQPGWSAPETDDTQSIALGDMDGDGDLDLAVGNRGSPNKVYLNDGLDKDGQLQMILGWTDSNSDSTQSITLGDFDNDGDLDLAVDASEDTRIYRNDGLNAQTTELQMRLAWTAPDRSFQSTAGDVNGDGRLDLVGSTQIYLNQGLTVQDELLMNPVPSPGAGQISDMSDMDADGDLDLAIGKTGINEVYRNNGPDSQGNPQWEITWSSLDKDDTISLAWGDVDGDGDLDLAVGNHDNPVKIYLNEMPPLQSKATPVFQDLVDSDVRTNSIAWGDVDGDGDLDLAAGGTGPNQLYLNEGGSLQPTAAWSSLNTDWTTSLAWGDVDGDGDLDLAAGGDGPNQLYLNEGGSLQPAAAWTSNDDHPVPTNSIAWGDVDGDGDLDLAAGNHGEPNQLYLNEGGSLQRTAAWSSLDKDGTTSLAWGDVDGDGDLDLAAGNHLNQNMLYLNEGGLLQSTAAWTSNDEFRTKSVAWGDMDGDGDLDLVVEDDETQNKIYFNEQGMLQKNAGWFSADSDNTGGCIALGDVDGDGDLDLATAVDLYSLTSYLNLGENPVKVYLNDNGNLQTSAVWRLKGGGCPLTWIDVDKDGDLDLISASADVDNKISDQPYTDQFNVYKNKNFSSPLFPGQFEAITIEDIGSPNANTTIPITYTLFHPAAAPVHSVKVFFSPDGGGRWLPAVAAANTITKNLGTASFPDRVSTNTHVFTWDVLASGFFGKSDNVVLRLEAYPGVAPITNSVAGPYQFPHVSTQSAPLKIQGTQVQVKNQTGENVPDAIVYQLPAKRAKGAQPITSGSGQTFRTDMQGFLQGRGSLTVNDTLVALSPVNAAEFTPRPVVSPTNAYSLYFTSAKPITSGLAAEPISEPGIQELTISEDNTLTLFNLDVALEWDARNDKQFLNQLEFDLQRTSELLYDWTNGQAALGKIKVYHYVQDDATQWLAPDVRVPKPWGTADIRIYASNRLRPNAAIGGVVSHVTYDPQEHEFAYAPGQIRMGAYWNRFGDAAGTLGEDWPRALAHELGHYLFFLNDHYLGFEDDILKPVKGCFGVMTDPYRNDYSEFNKDEWQDPACKETVTFQIGTKRSDWDTITQYYPWMTAEASNNGPSILPLAVTQIEYVAPVTPTDTVDVSLFYVSIEAEDGASNVLPSPKAQAFLFKDHRIVDLGNATQDRIEAHGAQPGDVLCLYDLDASTPRLGCETITPGDDQISVIEKPNWKPDIIISPVNSLTVKIEVPATSSNLQERDTGNVKAKIYPVDFEVLAEIELDYDENNERFIGEFNLDYPATKAYIQLWVDDEPRATRREVVAGYSLGGNPVPIQIGGTAIQDGGVPIQDGDMPIQDGGTPVQDGGVPIQGGGAPIQDGGVPVQWGGVPIQVGGVPIQTGGVPIQDGGVPVQVGGVPIQTGGVPTISSNGQVTLYTQKVAFKPGDFYTLQAATSLPTVPAWATEVGQGYRLTKSVDTLDLSNSSISFHYLEKEVPPGQEGWLGIYYWDGQTWGKLQTNLDTDLNLATAPARGVGLYALMSTLEIPLDEDWNLIAYPIHDERAVDDALASVEGKYTIVCGYDAESHQWAVYEPGNKKTLTKLEFGQGYWIKATEPITLQLRGVSESLLTDSLPDPDYGPGSKCPSVAE